MAKALKPETRKVKIGKHKVVTYSYGDGKEILFLLNGGPGLPCNYLRDPLLRMVDAGYRVVTYDQLGTGASDYPKDASLWTIGRYVEEVETVRNALDLGKIHLLGHSWGGWLSIEYAVTHVKALKSLVLSSTCADMPHLVGELDRHRAALGPETVSMMQRHEAEGTLKHPEYEAAITILNYRHVLRLADWPKPVTYSLKRWNMDVYGAMQGPNEFLYTGNLKDWNRIPDLHKITVPTLIVCGQHDEITPACSMRMHNALPDSEITVFPNSSHMAMYEEPEAYFARLTTFLDKQRGGNKSKRR
ncbi:MAG TPA: proline iminopeptidase-family hydrolase [Methylomirabilota bacterium]|nr:proline iminopeptidase-family hydrolase [Methylomirabilota bacterium]